MNAVIKIILSSSLLISISAIEGSQATNRLKKIMGHVAPAVPQPSIGIQAEPVAATQDYLKHKALEDHLVQQWKTKIAPHKNVIRSILHKEKEHEDDHIVIYNSQPFELRCLQDFLRLLYIWEFNKPVRDDYIFLRWWEKASGYSNVNDFLDTNTLTYSDVNDMTPHIADQLMSANISLFGNTYSNVGSATFDYFLNNKSASGNPSSLTKRLFTEIFSKHQFDAAFISEFQKLCRDIATQEGIITQLFVPKSMVDDCLYISQSFGIPVDKPYQDLNGTPLTLDFSTTKNRYAKCYSVIKKILYDAQYQSIQAVDKIQVRMLFNPTVVYPHTNTIKMYQYSTIDPTVLADYHKKFLALFNKMVPHSPISQPLTLSESDRSLLDLEVEETLKKITKMTLKESIEHRDWNNVKKELAKVSNIYGILTHSIISSLCVSSEGWDILRWVLKKQTPSKKDSVALSFILDKAINAEKKDIIDECSRHIDFTQSYFQEALKYGSKFLIQYIVEKGLINLYSFDWAPLENRLKSNRPWVGLEIAFYLIGQGAYNPHFSAFYPLTIKILAKQHEWGKIEKILNTIPTDKLIHPQIPFTDTLLLAIKDTQESIVEQFVDQGLPFDLLALMSEAVAQNKLGILKKLEKVWSRKPYKYIYNNDIYIDLTKLAIRSNNNSVVKYLLEKIDHKTNTLLNNLLKEVYLKTEDMIGVTKYLIEQNIPSTSPSCVFLKYLYDAPYRDRGALYALTATVFAEKKDWSSVEHIITTVPHKLLIHPLISFEKTLSLAIQEQQWRMVRLLSDLMPKPLDILNTAMEYTKNNTVEKYHFIEKAKYLIEKGIKDSENPLYYPLKIIMLAEKKQWNEIQKIIATIPHNKLIHPLISFKETIYLAIQNYQWNIAKELIKLSTTFGSKEQEDYIRTIEQHKGSPTPGLGKKITIITPQHTSATKTLSQTQPGMIQRALHSVQSLWNSIASWWNKKKGSLDHSKSRPPYYI